MLAPCCCSQFATARLFAAEKPSTKSSFPAFCPQSSSPYNVFGAEAPEPDALPVKAAGLSPEEVAAVGLKYNTKRESTTC